MRPVLLPFLIALAAVPAGASDQVLTGPRPPWAAAIVPGTAVDPAPSDLPAEIALLEQRFWLEPGVTHQFTRQRIRFNKPEGLAAGNLALQWRAERDTLTIHEVTIHRGAQRIDVLASGQKFAILRREANLESAMLDGVLTASLQPEGLQVGDVLEIAATIVRREPVMGNFAELALAPPDGAVGRFLLSAHWPSGLAMRHKVGGGLPALAIREEKGRTGFQLTLDRPTAREATPGAPLRTLLARRIELSSIPDWSAIGTLFAPLYAKAAVIPLAGPLRAELDKIRAASTNPVRRAELALALVQDRLRYVAIALGDGGLVPDSAEAAWDRRFGDCKAKTALLLALLGELGIKAVPVAVHVQAGDGMDQRLPMVSQFNHILVRAEIGGRTYWLDGTRSGDTSLARLETPFLRWGAEILPAGGKLVPIVPAARTIPDDEIVTTIDASGGFTLPAKVTTQMTLRGDGGLGLALLWAQLPPDKRNEGLKQIVGERFPAVRIGSVSGTPDRASGTFRIDLTGSLDIDSTSPLLLSALVSQEPVEERRTGADRDAPLALDFPSFSRLSQTLIVPADFPADQRKEHAPVATILAGVEHRRTARWQGNRLTVVTDERTLVPEIPWSEALAARGAIRTLAANKISLRPPANYRADQRDVEALAKLDVSGVEQRLDRAFKLLESGRPDLSIADLDIVLKEEPGNASALANRGLAKAWLRRKEEAEADFAAAEKVNPDDPVVWRGRALQALFDDELTEALRLFDKAVTLDDDNAFAYDYRARLHLRLGQFDEALADSARLRQLSPESSSVSLLRASIFRLRGDRDKALAELQLLAAATDSSVLFGLAEEYRSLGSFDEAMKALGKAIGSSPPSAPTLLRRAQFRSLSDKAGRRADLQAFLAKEPTSPVGVTMLGQLLEEEGRTAEAIKLYTKGMAALSDSSPLRLRRGIALMRSGKTAEGLRDISAARASEAGATDLNNRCWALATAGVALDQALADCQAALAKRPNHFAFLDSRAMVHLKQGKLDLALADYDRSLANGPVAAALMGRSLVHARRGDAARAAADRQAAMRHDPEIGLRFLGYGFKEAAVVQAGS